MTGSRARVAVDHRILPAGMALALSCGIVDVCIALLNKPRGFETLAAVPPAILATAAITLGAYALLWAVLRPAAARLGVDQSAAQFGLAAFLGSAFTMALLAGLQAASVTPQAVFRAAAVVALSALLGAGIYAQSVMRGRDLVLPVSNAAAVAAVPLLLFEVLVYEWLQVYAIDRLASVSSVLLTMAFVVVASATVAAVRYALPRWPAARQLAAFTLLLAAAPALAAVGARRADTVQAVGLGSERAPKRIILITVDTLRADAVSSYRASAPPTAAIDRLAHDGVLFEHALAPAPWTLPSLTSILTGLAPAAHRATGFTSSVSQNITTLAEYLHDRGYRTAAIVHNDLLNRRNGLSQGFGEYVTLEEQYYARSVGMTALQTVAPAWFPPPTWPTNDDQTRIAVDWLESNRDQRFFLWLHYLDPHAPYSPPREYRTAAPLPSIGPSFEGQKTAAQGFFVPSVEEREAIRALYHGEVRYVDASIGRFMAALERLGLYEDALVVFTSDHGEEFWEHGQLGHGHTLYDELLRVPLIVKLPGAKRHGRIADAVSTVSVAPTILDASGIRYDAGNVSAPSLMPLVDPSGGVYRDGPVASGAQIMFDHRDAIYFERFKYIVSSVDGKEELFDLTADPGEQHSIAVSAPDRLDEGRRLLKADVASAAALRKRIRVEAGTIAADEDTLRRLRTLGYLR